VKKFTFVSKVILWSGDSAWHFAYVDDSQSTMLRNMPRKKRRGFGALKVRATIGKTTFDSSLFPTKEGPYLLPLKKSVRFAEGIEAGEKITVACTLL
jgi:hypothetical protein